MVNDRGVHACREPRHSVSVHDSTFGCEMQQSHEASEPHPPEGSLDSGHEARALARVSVRCWGGGGVLGYTARPHKAIAISVMMAAGEGFPVQRGVALSPHAWKR